MERYEDHLIVSATDLVNHLECGHLTSLNRTEADRGRGRGPADEPEVPGDDALRDILRRHGDAHERRHLESLRTSGSVVEIGRPDHARDRIEGLGVLESDTLRAMTDGADVIFQATFLDRRGSVLWRGHADFLHRVELPSRLGTHSYEPEDTKLARRVKAATVMQLCHYAEQVERLQGAAPDLIHAVLGDGRRETLRLAEISAYYRAARNRFLVDLDDGPVTYPLPVSHCAVCTWAEQCADRRDTDDHLCRVASLTREQATRFEAAGIPTVAALAGTGEDFSVPRIGVATLTRLRRQARLQHESIAGSPPPFELVTGAEHGRGLDSLPEPDAGDVFYDIEGDPFAADEGLEYLHGLGWIGDDGTFVFEPVWAHDAAAERRAFEKVIDTIVERRHRHPNMHVYHYAPYETTALGRLMGRYGTREDPLDDLLRGEVFVDLLRVVRQGVIVGSPSYSLKKIEPLYRGARTGPVTDAGSSIVQYELWLESKEQKILDEIEAYNRDDLESTWQLRDWLLRQRDTVAPTATTGTGAGSADTNRMATPAPDTTDEAAPSPVDADLVRLSEALLDGIDAPPADDAADDQRVRWLMAQLLQWHRREDKPAWWRFFRRVRDLDEQDLYDDTEAIAGLQLAGTPVTSKQSLVWRYEFDPDQEHKLSAGAAVRDPAGERADLDGADGWAPGTLVALDPVAGTLELRRSKKRTGPHPRALIPGAPIQTTEQKMALRRLAETLLAHGVDTDEPGGAALQLLARRPPRIHGTEPGMALRRRGEPTVDATVRLVLGLDRSYLPIQGPPGAGKTYTAAGAIVALVKDGRQVGITASSHSVITTVLQEVVEQAEKAGVTVRAMQNASEGKARVMHDSVTITRNNAKIDTAVADGEVDVVAGTAWVFAREAMAGTLDTLVVDEAGQLSLANVAAVAGAARNLVLVGDPQQLAQPSQGSHPPGAEVSALDHALAGDATVDDARGLFLDRTWRMHPAITEFISEQVYEGRLESAEHCSVQTLGAGHLVEGSGLRWLPVDQEGNRSSSPAEAAAAAEIYRAVLGRPWTDRHGASRIIGIDDILVVAPYNAQVRCLTEALPDGARIGTVDRFQGQEAAVVVVSLATSSIDEIPRGMEFLYSRNRLNVAVSRAQALAVMIASPTLLSVRCRTVEQIRLANVLCRYAEMAERIALDDDGGEVST